MGTLVKLGAKIVKNKQLNKNIGTKNVLPLFQEVCQVVKRGAL